MSRELLGRGRKGVEGWRGGGMDGVEGWRGGTRSIPISMLLSRFNDRRALSLTSLRPARS